MAPKNTREVPAEQLRAADELANLASTLRARASALRMVGADKDFVSETLVLVGKLRELLSDGLTWRERLAVYCEVEGRQIRGGGDPHDVPTKAARAIKAAGAPRSVKPVDVERLISALGQPPNVGGRSRRRSSAVDEAYHTLFRVDAASIRKHIARVLQERRGDAKP